MAVNLQAVSTGELANELHRRRVSVLAGMEDIHLVGVTISPSRQFVAWNNTFVRLRPKEMEVLQAIAAAHPRAVTTIQIACALYESGSKANCDAVRVYVSELRKLLPGLLNEATRGSRQRTYYLAGLDTPRRTPVRVVNTEGER